MLRFFVPQVLLELVGNREVVAETSRFGQVTIIQTIDLVEVLQTVTNSVTVGVPVDTMEGTQPIG